MHSSTFSRRQVLSMLAAGALAPYAGALRAQQPWKATRPIRLIVPFPPGGSTDIIARVLAEALGDKLGQPVIVDNRGGALGAIGLQLAFNAPPDGHTLVIGATDSTTVYPYLRTKQAFKAEDFVPVAPIGVIPFVLTARKGLGANTAPEVVALARQKQLTYGSWGNGSAAHLATALFMRATGLPPESLLHVPYTGVGPAAQAVASGEIDLLFSAVPLAVSQRGLSTNIALIHPKRVDALPEVPTLAEQGITVKMDGEFWMGVLAPPKTPANIVEATSAAFAEVLATPELIARMDSLGVVPQGTMGPEEYGAFFSNEFERWGKVIREAEIKPQ